jgi:hypothetical protein
VQRKLLPLLFLAIMPIHKNKIKKYNYNSTKKKKKDTKNNTWIETVLKEPAASTYYYGSLL